MRARSILIGFALVIAGCNKREEAPRTEPTQAQMPPPTRKPTVPIDARVEVQKVELGNAIGSDKRVLAPTNELRPADTIYVSVETKGSAPDATLTARWKSSDGRIVEEVSQKVATALEGPTVTQFEARRPDGWQPGQYELEILLDGDEVESKEFKVGAG